jgi:hypothetical protein
MGLTLQTPPGYSDLADAALVANDPAYAINLAKIYSNSVFGMVRPEIFLAIYKNGDTVALPVSPVDGYSYSRDELIYVWTIRNSVNPATGWISADDSLFFCSWKVDQSTGQVFSDEWYRRSGSHADVTHTNDGSLLVWTIAQRQQSHLIMAASPTYVTIDPSWIGIDKPYSQQLAQGLNNDAKFGVVNKEVFYLGEYYNGQTVTLPTSPCDGHSYTAGECQFMFSWRWTTQGNTAKLVQPPLSDGQLAPIKASVDASGNVSITVQYVDNNGNLITTHDGRVAVFAFCRRTGTPASLAAVADLFEEISYDFFMPGSPLPAEAPDNIPLQILNNILEAILAVEYFGPTDYGDGDTVPTPTSTVDGYAYQRSELTYVWTWADTTNQEGNNLRVPLFLANIDQITGVVSIEVWRLPPGGPLIDDDNALARLSVLVVARRAAQAQSVLTPPDTSPQADSNTGGNQVFDVPTLGGEVLDILSPQCDGTNTVFNLSRTPLSGTMVKLIWNATWHILDFDVSGTQITTNFVDPGTRNPIAPDTGDSLYALYFV